MKCLRVSMYPPMGNAEPMTVVMRDIDMKVGPDYFEAENMSEMGDGAFIITDVFEIDDADSGIINATTVAIQRQEERSTDESNMAILYYYTADMFQWLQPGGVITSKREAPFSRERVEQTLLMLSNHPAYNRYTIICADEDFNLVTLRNGEIV